MNDLHRELAPICQAAWDQIEAEAKRTLTSRLAARQVVDFSGPHGWTRDAVGLGRVQVLRRAPGAGVEARLRRVRPLVELRAPFELDRAELEAIGRGAEDADLGAAVAAARAIATAEDRAVFYGYAEAGIAGICEAATALTIPADYVGYPSVVAAALSRLRQAAVGGPYAICLGPRCYTGLTETTAGGYPVIEHVRRLVDGPLIWAPAVDGAVVVSLRGGDFALTVGQDFCIGYDGHTADRVRLYIQESLTFRVIGAEAAVPLAYAEAGSRRRRR